MVVGVLIVVAALLFELPLGHAAALAPIVVVAAAATVGLVIFWIRVGLTEFQHAKHPRLIVGSIVGVVVVVVVLTLLGVQLPRE